MRTTLERLAVFARRRYRLIFAIYGLLALASGLLILRLSFDTDMMNLLPRRDPVVSSYVETLKDFGSQTFLLIAVKIPEGAVVDPYESLVDELAGRLAKVPELKNIQHRIGDPTELLETFFPKALLFIDEQGRNQLAAKLQDDAIRQRVSELRRQLMTPQAIALKELARHDPFGLSEIFLGRLESSRGTLNVDWTSGYYLSRDHRLLLILAEPVKPPQDIPFTEKLAANVDREIAGTVADWDKIAGPDAPPRPVVEAGGPHLTAVGDASLIRKDMIVNIITSALGVFILFLFAFRRLGALTYAFVPLLCGLLLTFGFAAAVFGSLSSATSVVAALLIGLGIDFVIVSYGRYVEERRAGASLEQALAAMCGATGPAVMAGAITTAATFYAFTFTDFTGLRQMGLLTGTGILFCMVSVLTLLPAMLAWSEDHHQKRQTAPRLYLYSFGTNRLTALCMRHPVTALIAGVALTLLGLSFAFRIQFDESMKTMRPTGNRGIEVAVEVGKHFGSGFDAMILTVTGKSLEEVLALSDRAAAGAKGLVNEGVLYGFSGPTSLIPPESQQRAALRWLEENRGGARAHARRRAPHGGAGPAAGSLRAGPDPAVPGGQPEAAHRPPGLRELAADQAAPRPLSEEEGGRLEGRRLPLPAGQPLAPGGSAAGPADGGAAGAAGPALGGQRGQPAGPRHGAERRLDRRHPRPGAGDPHPVGGLPQPALGAAGPHAAAGRDHPDAGGNGALRHPDELHQHLRHHDDHRHRGGLRHLHPPPLRRGPRPAAGAVRAGAPGDRQGGGGGRDLHHRGLRVHHLLSLLGSADDGRGGDPGSPLHVAGGDHAAAEFPELAAGGGDEGYSPSSTRAHFGGHQKRTGATDIPTPGLM
jgi:predicted exporter